MGNLEQLKSKLIRLVSERDRNNQAITDLKKLYVEMIIPTARRKIGDVYECMDSYDPLEVGRLYEIVNIETNDAGEIIYIVKETRFTSSGRPNTFTYKRNDAEMDSIFSYGYVKIRNGKKFPAHDGCYGVWMSEDSPCNMCSHCRFFDPDSSDKLDPSANPMQCKFIGVDIRGALLADTGVDWEGISFDNLKEIAKDIAMKIKK